MNKLFLGLIKLFNPLWKSMGVNLPQLYAILKAKLKMDLRRKSGMYTGMQTDSSSSNMQYLSLFFMCVAGALVLGFSLSFGHLPTGLTVYFSIWMVLLSMTVIMDFSDVLIDTSDAYTLTPTPVNDVTLSVSRILRILIFIGKQALAFIFPALIYWGVTSFVGLLVFTLQSFLVVIMSISLVSLVYLTAIKFVSASRIKNLINNLQIGFTVVIFGAYYLLPKLIDIEDGMDNINVFDSIYSYLAPSAWIAAIWELLINNITSIQILMHVALSIVGSLGALIFISKYLSKDLSQQLFNINLDSASTKISTKTSTDANADINQKVQTTKSSSYVDKIASLLTFDKVERGAFKFCYRYLSRDRMFKLKTYPVLGYVPIVVISILINGDGSLMERLAYIQSGKYYLGMYIVAFLGFIAIMNARFTETPKQSWIFRAAPLKHPKSILYALYKVICVKFLLPAWLILFILSICLSGVHVVDDFLFGGIVILFIGLFTLKVSLRGLPFTKPWAEMQKGSGNFLKMMLLWFALAAIIGVHYFLLKSFLALLAASLVLLVAFYFFWRSFDELTWEKLEW